ncbi:hypothetical protein [Nocardioides sp.]|uniref:hypothetical protein n=1 Tax=Nocardioides sp. TaxID=35761 RepID=UPI003514DEE2
MRSRSRIRWAVPVLLALPLLPLLSACGDDDVAPRTPLPTAPAEALWNPCSALDLAEVGDLFDERYRVDTGTDTEPRCTFTPGADGGTAVDVNYQLYDGTLKDVVAELPPPGEDATLTAPRLPDANGVRILSSIDGDTLAVTGFVRNGRLVQVVNALDPTPFDRPRVVSGVREVLAALAAAADESGLSGPN